MIDGCLEWQRRGLAPPAVVVEATSAYLDAEDMLNTWIAECCDVGTSYKSTNAHLFASWKCWAEGASEPVGTQRQLPSRLEEKGFTRFRNKAARGLVGLRICPGERQIRSPPRPR